MSTPELPRLESAVPGGHDHRPREQRLAVRGVQRDRLVVAVLDRVDHGAQPDVRRVLQRLVGELVDQRLAVDLGEAGDVEDVLLGIDRADLAAELLERLDDPYRRVAMPAVVRGGKTRRATPDHRDVNDLVGVSHRLLLVRGRRVWIQTLPFRPCARAGRQNTRMPADRRLAVIETLAAGWEVEGADVPIRRAFPTRERRRFDPFLLLDDAGPVAFAPGEAVGVPEHRHRGIETVGYLLAGEIVHRDSQGAERGARPRRRAADDGRRGHPPLGAGLGRVPHGRRRAARGAAVGRPAARPARCRARAPRAACPRRARRPRAERDGQGAGRPARGRAQPAGHAHGGGRDARLRTPRHDGRDRRARRPHRAGLRALRTAPRPAARARARRRRAGAGRRPGADRADRRAGPQPRRSRSPGRSRRRARRPPRPRPSPGRSCRSRRPTPRSGC